MNYEYHRDKQEYFSIGKCSCGAHFHRAIEILYCIEKPKQVTVSGVEYTVEEGEALFVCPCSEHVFPVIEGHVSLCAVFPAVYTDIWEKNTGGRHLGDPVIKDKTLARDIYEHLLRLESCKSELLKDGIYSYVLGSVIAGSELVEQTGFEDAAFAMRTIEYLEKNYSRNITLDELSRALGYNRCYFSTLFGKNFRTGFRSYLNSMRIERSIRLLGSIPVPEIAHRVGYECVQAYYRNFRSVMGCTPGEYMRALEGVCRTDKR